VDTFAPGSDWDGDVGRGRGDLLRAARQGSALNRQAIAKVFHLFAEVDLPRRPTYVGRRMVKKFEKRDDAGYYVRSA
jgi:hypothetical protein